MSSCTGGKMYSPYSQEQVAPSVTALSQGKIAKENAFLVPGGRGLFMGLFHELEPLVGILVFILMPYQGRPRHRLQSDCSLNDPSVVCPETTCLAQYHSQLALPTSLGAVSFAAVALYPGPQVTGRQGGDSMGRTCQELEDLPLWVEPDLSRGSGLASIAS